mmetsp:Transcript_13943/g.24421  ORF Transcript_13943/g.24421 Transcript_13943/m.24421 type:complete len:629 (-) Transcript_13943:77-1963(-)
MPTRPRGLKYVVLILWLHPPAAARQGCAGSYQEEVCSAEGLGPEDASSAAPALLQHSVRRSAVHREAELPTRQLPEKRPGKFLAGVPVYNYDYVHLCDEDGLCLLEANAQKASKPGQNESRDDWERHWEEDFLKNNDNDDGELPKRKEVENDNSDLDAHEHARRKKQGTMGQVRQWIVKLRDGISDQALGDFCEEMRGKGLCTAKGHPSVGGVPMVVIRASEANLEEQLYRHVGDSDFVEPDIVMTAIPEVLSREEANDTNIGASSVGGHEKAASWGLDRIDDREGLDETYDIDFKGGEGVHVYVADTGMLTRHEDFQGRARPTLEILSTGEMIECRQNDHRCAQDGNGHGTHAAGTVGGRKYGVAKASTLHSVKILSDAGRGRMSYLIQALDWVVANGQRPAIFTASLETPGNPPSVVKAIEAAVASGVTVIVAAGNFGRDACNYSPAHIRAAITVGATESADDRLAPYSNFGACVDVFAPGSNIVSTGQISKTAKATMSGTSMACPHVAGAAALLLGEDHSRAPEEIQLLLQARATQGVLKGLGEDGSPNLMLFAAPLQAGDELFLQAALTPQVHWRHWRSILVPGPLKELFAEAFVCGLFLFALVYMTFRCGRFISAAPGSQDAA